MAIKLPSYNEILGKSVRKMIADSVVNDVNRGSVLLSLLEAVAAQDFENSASILATLEALSIDALKNADLDARAADYGLTRFTATRATGLVDVSDSSITKQSTTLYAAKLPPVAGSSTLYVNDASTWIAPGTLYIGRGTAQFEGPIPYTSITNNGSFYTIALGSSLQKDHLVSDNVVDAQGTTDRLIASGTVVKIPSNNQSPEIRYTVLRDAVLAAGEDTISGIAIAAQAVGSSSNAGARSIVAFQSVPFVNATVTNSTDIIDGRNAETDDQLRERVKNYVNTLAKGTADAILAAVIGQSDSTDHKQVASATISEPTSAGLPSTLHIDDGTGFQPSYVGQNIDVLINSAVGDEKFLQLANFPLPRPQVVNQADGPYELVDGSYIKISVDSEEEQITFTTAMFDNISSATLAEIAVAINNNALRVRCRLTEDSSRLLVYTEDYAAEYIQVSAFKVGDTDTLFANNILKFPTNKYSYIELYRNNQLLHEKLRAAELLSASFSTWSVTTSGNLIIQVDGTPSQDQTFTTLDFNSQPLNAVSLTDWVAALNLKFAGITAEETTSGTALIKSNKEGNASSLNIIGGTLAGQIFGLNTTSSTGSNSDFTLNRMTGNLELKITLSPGDIVSAGVLDAKGTVTSTTTTTGTYDLSNDTNNRVSEMVIVTDMATIARTNVQPAVGNSITISAPNSKTMRIMGNNASSFLAVQVGDFIFITNRGDTLGSGSWIAADSCGLFKVKAKGDHISNGVDTYLDVTNLSTVVGGPYTIQDSADIQVFSAQDYPQLWKSSFVVAPASASLQEIIDSLNTELLNVKGSIFKTKSFKITSTTENDGSIAIPVSIGKVANVIASKQGSIYGNPSNVGTKISDKDLVSGFRRTAPIKLNVWLDRYIYTDVRSTLDADAIPNPAGYSELLTSASLFTPSIMGYDDYVNVTSGANKSQFRSIKEFISSDQVGTQINTPTTLFDYVAGDNIDAFRSLEIAADDSMVFVLDNDPVNKTVNIPFWRTGKINTQYAPSTTAFSADDVDNEPGIDFSNLQIWPVTTTNFGDYALWMRSHNWYRTSGAASSGATMILRANEYGPNGDKYQFKLDYPSVGNQAYNFSHVNSPVGTVNTYTFASGAERNAGIIGGTEFKVANLSTDNWRYTFQENYVDFSSLVVGDIISLLDNSGVSSANRGSFYINNFNVAGRYLDVYNPSGVATSIGQPEITTIDTGNAGVKAVYDITTTAEGSTSSTVGSGDCFGLYDGIDLVIFWYAVNNVGSQPTKTGATRYVKIGTITTGDSATVVATKTAAVIATDSAFSATSFGNVATVTNLFYGVTTLPSDFSTATTSSGDGLGFTYVTNTAGQSGLRGSSYFTIYDQNGSVAVWFDLYGDAEPPHGDDRSIQVIVPPGSSANALAALLSSTVGADSQFSSSVSANNVIITDSFNGVRQDAAYGNAPYAPNFASFGTTQQGIDDGVETINMTSGCHIFSLTGNDVATIASNMNSQSTSLMNSVAVGNLALLFTKATREDVYVYTGDSSALAYGHNPTPGSGLNGFVSLFDGQSFVKTFDNASPQFVLKKDLLLPGVVPAIYDMSSVPNANSAALGEYFKLLPKTVKNVKQQLSHKALSSLPIVADIDIADNFRRIQVKSKKVGSVSSVEMVGGRANIASFSIVGDGNLSISSGVDYAELQVSAFPATLNADDLVRIYNSLPARRLSRLTSTNTISVLSPSTSNFLYAFNSRNILSSSGKQWTITDASGTYSKPTGTVFRWTHNGLATDLNTVVAGDVLNAYGLASPWSMRNMSQATGDNQVSGYPVIAVNAASKYVDIVNPNGATMVSTATGAGTVSIGPTPVLRWRLKQAALNKIVSIVVSGGIATVLTTDAHGLENSASVNILDSGFSGLNGIKTVVTAPTFNSFTFSTVAVNGTYTGGSAIKNGLLNTLYTIEKLGFNGLTRISWKSGRTPDFIDCGAAVDDFVVLKGSSFNVANNGRYRILGVDNNSLIIKNDQAIEELNTNHDINGNSVSAIWTANSNKVTGAAGTFEYLSVGNWIKKSTDSDSMLLQVLGMDNSPSLATSITLGDIYRGTTGTSPGVYIDLVNDIGTGVILKSVEDLAIYDGDSVVVDDSLVVENISDAAWFSQGNAGVFTVKAWGSYAPDMRPYLQVFNLNGTTQSNRAMSVNVNGFYILEGANNLYETYRQVNHSAIDSANANLRDVYLTPADRLYKMSQNYETHIESSGKVGFKVGISTGIDGYLYYTGLMRTVQRTVDGFEPDVSNYPGQRAAGVIIETLAPLINRIEIALDITTQDGINLSDVTNDIRSVIISYVNGLGVGSDVVMSEIIAAVMGISGINAATFTKPVPSTERITILADQKAYITADLISLA